MSPLRMTTRARFVSTALLVAATSLATAATPDTSSARAVTKEAARVDATIRTAVARLPLSFVANRGQADARVSFYLQGKESTVFFSRAGMTLAMSGWTVRQHFPGSSPTTPVAATAPARGIVSYFDGPRHNWTTGVPTYRAVAYQNLWPGIDLTYSGGSGRLEYTFGLAPSADPRSIRISYQGATTSLTGAGGLRVATPVASFTDRAPVAYQTIGGRRVPVTARFVKLPDHSSYGFRVGTYDHGRPLVIDPVMIGYAGYIGGAGFEDPYGIGVDGQGHAFLMGETKSDASTFPVKIGPGVTYGGNGDAFVCKVEADGSSLDYCGYIGGSNWDRGRAIAVDAAGDAYVVGHTKSKPSQGFPVTVGPSLTFGGNADAFVCKVNPTGTALDYCGYIGGKLHDEAKAVAVDAAGNAYVTGGTKSTEANGFPVKGGPDLTANGEGDVWVAKVSADGTHLIYCGYVGGSKDEHARGIDVDAQGNAYVGGSTASSQHDGFPLLVGPDLTLNGARDAFVAKVSADGSHLIYSGYVGGSGTEEVYGLRVNAGGNAYIAGSTNATEATFPVLVGPDLTYNGGPRDAFVTEVSADGSSLVYSGYIGGDQHDGARGGLDLDAAGDAFVTGGTKSSEATFPVLNGPDPTFNGGQDAFVCQVSPDGSHLIFSGYIGGGGYEEGRGIAVDSDGTVYVGGSTGSREGSFPVKGGPDLTYNGGQTDGFVAALVPA